MQLYQSAYNTFRVPIAAGSFTLFPLFWHQNTFSTIAILIVTVLFLYLIIPSFGQEYSSLSLYCDSYRPCLLYLISSLLTLSHTC